MSNYTMRRTRQALDEKELQKVITACNAGVFSLILPDGQPYGVPVSYAWDGSSFYFHGSKDGLKMQAIRHCALACFTIIYQNELVPQALTTRYVSIIAMGHVEILQSPAEKRKALQLLCDQLAGENDPAYNADKIEASLQDVCMLKFVVKEITGKKSSRFAKENKEI